MEPPSEEVEQQINTRLLEVERALWGTERDREAGIVFQVRGLRKRADAILIGVLVAIITPAATILLTRAAG
jgi:hypothetical protein